jgi:hypothetical protein
MSLLSEYPKSPNGDQSPILWTKIEIEIELGASVRDRDRASKLDLDLDLCPKDRAQIDFSIGGMPELKPCKR